MSKCEEGDYLVCIQDCQYEGFTLGNYYKIFKVISDSALFKNDDNQTRFINTSNPNDKIFKHITFNEFRRLKIEKICSK